MYKLTLSILLTLFTVIIFADKKIEKVNVSDLKFENKLCYKKDSGKLFTGKLITKHKNGKDKYESTYKAGKKVGVDKEWYLNGALKTQVNFNENQNMHKILTKWYNNGVKLSETMYKDGVKVGVYKEWWTNEKLKTQVNFNKNGEMHGLLTTWYDTGAKLSETTYENGKKVKFFQEWWPNGKMKTKIGFNKDGRKHGVETTWYDNGVKYQETSYHKGFPSGKQITWDKKGKQIRVSILN